MQRDDRSRDKSEYSETPARKNVDGGCEERQFMARAGLTYFDKSRRRFLQLSGLTLAGLFLPGTIFGDSSARPGRVSFDKAIALALQDAGVKVVTHVPATGATAVFDTYSRLAGLTPSYAFNEEVAYTMAHGAALSGGRSATVIKSHGLAKASNSMIDSLTMGTTAGFVAIVMDDPTGRHSDNIFDLEAFLKGTGMPFKKAGHDTVYDDLLESFLWSEKLGIPVVLFVNAELISHKTSVARRSVQAPVLKYRRDPLRHVVCPPLAGYQKKVLEAKLSGKDWRDVSEPVMPAMPDGLPPVWRKAALQYTPLFDVFKEFRPQIPFVCGDTGLSTFFSFAPYDCVDAAGYYGGSLPTALGFYLGSSARAWAVTGDYAFIAAGHMGLFEALARRAPLKVLVIDNGCAMATGCQPIADGIFEQLLSGWKPFVSRIENVRDKPAVRRAFDRAIKSDRLEIVVANIRKG
jgi:TPP-dependent indolepyruvate ferredoxin oxidoreductase alpha subunit